ncbi:hypothetical protein DFW101_3656 (plasmid) [Solidesulfovibrio carbinoliphilus subsp. oakridgensis]|uniref:Glycosyltransferase RgtA/B/C/D-like domain-containing protein n=1 Tax=Solidesulfovibrio carbinoliphilus subsp. oakridgensis TaxID=694327 RepID=G7QE46_9BACT|nr:hypothetical protein [Solidesulfovibrio carbinoliphilus]EHJ45940.1 hypothetical protein DFW101_3656 [Solidesulfovibrio carbinoliphilus subsp. oakridgensis]
MTGREGLFEGSRGFSWLPLLLSLAFGAGVSLALGQDCNWDLRNYHFYNVHAWLGDRYRFDIAPAQRQTFLSPLLDLPFYGLIQVLNDWPRLVAALLGAWQGLNYYVLWRIARLLLVVAGAPGLSLAAAGLATLVGATGAALLPVVGSTMNDAPATTLVLAALFLLLRDAKNGDAGSSRAVWLAGGLVGLAVGLKLTIALYAVAVAAALAGFYGLRRFPAQAWRFCLAAGLGLLVTDGFFLWKMWRLFGNPFFPFYNNLFHSPYAAPLPFDDPRFLPAGLWQALAYPFVWATRLTTVVSEPPLRDPRFAVVLVIGLLAGCRWLVARRSAISRPWLGLVVFWVVAYAFWLKKFAILRYLAGLELLTGVLLCAGCLVLFQSPRRALWAMACLAALLLATTRYPDWGRLPFGDTVMDARVPALPPESTVFLLNDEGLAYVIPFFDPRVRFVALQNNLIKPGQDNLLRRQALSLVRHLPEPLFAIDSRTGDPPVEQTLREHGLERLDDTCAPIRYNGRETTLRLCQVRRATGTDGF